MAIGEENWFYQFSIVSIWCSAERVLLSPILWKWNMESGVMKWWRQNSSLGLALSVACVLCSRPAVGKLWLMGSIRPAVYFSQWSFIRNTATPVPHILSLAALSWHSRAEPLWQRPHGLRSWKSLLSELLLKKSANSVLDSNVRPVLQMLFN